MMRLASLVAMVTLAGCSSAGEKAEKRSDIVERTGDLAAICEAKSEVRDAYLQDGDEAKYRNWRLYAAAACARAKSNSHAGKLDSNEGMDVIPEIQNRP